MRYKTRIVLNMFVGLGLLQGCAESSVDKEALCGNGAIDPGEECDQTNLGAATCGSVLEISSAGGTLGCNPDCTFDTTQCSVNQCSSESTYCDENKVWHYCEAGMDQTKTCGKGENTNKPYCDDTLGCLVAENGCKDGETACNGSQPQICSDGHWINNGAVCPLGCNLQTHSCNDQLVSCEDDDVQCNGNTVQTCVSGTWQDASSPCPFGCTDGVCNTENRVCEEDAIQCNGAYVETCQENTWVRASSPCPFGCTDGVCNPENMTCREGDKKCNGASIQECSGNAWNNTITCTNGCRSGSCIHNCEATDKTCNGLQPQKCQVAETGNVYVDDGAACPFGCDASTGTCTSAKNCTGLSGDVSHGTSGCVSATQYGTCNDGAWTGTKTCAPNETCDATKGECVSKCSSHDDCTDSNAPSCIDSKCDKCTGDDQCGEGKVCNEDTGACEVPGGRSYSTDFNFITGTDQRYDKEYSYTSDTDGYMIKVVGRADTKNSTTADYTIDGAGIILNKTGTHIEVSGITGGIGKIKFDYNGWDAATIYVSDGAFNNGEKPTASTKEESIKAEKSTADPSNENKAIDKLVTGKTVTINSDATSFVIYTKASSNNRIVIDNLSWTNK